MARFQDKLRQAAAQGNTKAQQILDAMLNTVQSAKDRAVNRIRMMLRR